MITNIARLLQARKPNAPAEWMQKLPQMARRLEESLFRSAVSFDDYRETQTLKKRLQALAIAMGLRAQQQKQKTTEDPPPMLSSSSTTDEHTDASSHLAQNLDDTSARNIADACTAAHKSEESGIASDIPLTSNASSEKTIVPGTKRLVKLSETKPLAEGRSASEDGSSQRLKIDSDMSSRNVVSLGTGGPLNDATTVQRPYHADQRQQVLRQQQQRLLLLRHASKCPHENGSCPVTPHCVGMKRLWKHIAECKDQQCQMAHCVSSRYVLSHYHRCKDPRCAVCGPVREAIQRNHEKAKQLAMAQHAASTGRENSNNDLPAESGSHLGQSATTRNERTSRQRNVTVKTAKGFNIGYGYGMPLNTLDSRNSRVNIDSAATNRIASSDARTRLADRCTTTTTPGRVEEGTSLLNSFTPSQIHAHLQSLKTGLRLTSAKIRQKCFPVLKRLIEHECSWIFMQPVDPVELNLPDYFEIIETPMDLGTIKKKMENNNYKLISEFVADVRLTFDNAIAYNGEGSDVCKVARDMKMTFEKLHSAMIASIDAEEEQRKSSGDVCVLCGCEKLLFEPTVYYCNGSCNGQRIRRNSYYYTGGRNQYHWCQQCFNELKEKDPLEFPDCTLSKRELQKKKNDEMHEEPWVECSQCNRWVHQICALFNGRMNKGTQTIYHCPFCFMARRSTREPQSKPLAAKDIRHTKMSRFLEDRVVKCLKDAYINVKNSSVRDSEKSSAIYVRQLSNIDKMHQAKPRMLQRYTDLHYPREFPARSKCVLLFQEMDGVDVILFGMYLYEYGHRCPLPNQRCVYVSYLDSVYYFRPRQFRTMVYHEMLIAYLAHVKQRGFHTAHIWACPPCKGDDYIFFCHPEDQKTPKDDRLRSWYITLLETAKTEGIVTHITNLWKEHFKSDHNATVVPYFEGDYWPGEAENVIKAIDEEANERNDIKARKAGNSVKSKSKAKGRFARGLRSDGSAEEGQGQDSLVLRMGKILEPMKDAFIVAYLGPRKFASTMARRYTAENRPITESGKTNVPGDSTGMAHGVPRLDECPSKSTEQMDQCNKIATPTSKQDTPCTAIRTKGDASSVEKCKSEKSIGKAVFDETEDTDEIIESEFYDTRQQFLNLCQGNHYQFDELRRAKHTSMMSLYHLHNPDVPKFLVTCSNCNMDINVGYCFNSEKDPEFHLCQGCYQKTHKLYADKGPFRRSLVGGDSQAQLTEEQRRDRQRSIQLHMQLLQHASGCQNQQCPSANCNKMKNLLKHGATCATRVQGGCAICRRIWALLQIHARQCRRDSCMVPKCRQLKEQLRALAQQQAQMDERRRAAMNAAYRMSPNQ
jgi:E1A/CREB-binding protein